ASTGSRVVWKRTRASNHTPAIASSVLPKAIPSAAGSGAPATRLTQRAPANTPGQRRKPKSHRVASAMPVGGQTSVAKPATASRRSPSRAVTKYAAKRRTQPRATSVRLFSSLMAADHDQLERDVQWEGGFPTRPGREAPRRASREVLWRHHGRDDVVSGDARWHGAGLLLAAGRGEGTRRRRDPGVVGCAGAGQGRVRSAGAHGVQRARARSLRRQGDPLPRPGCRERRGVVPGLQGRGRE